MTPKTTGRFLSLLTAGVMLAAGASAEFATVASLDDSRDDAQLKVEMRDAMRHDTDVANTALVFNNTGNSEAVVYCRAFGPDGRALGRKVARIPKKGLRYLRASDLAGGADFIGSATCTTRVRVVASAVFLAPGVLTNLDVVQLGPWDDSTIRFPLIATY